MMMFSCFNAHIHSHKPKKAVELSVETNCGSSPNNLTVKDPKTSPKHSTLNSVFLKDFGNSQVTEGTDDVRSSLSIDRSWKSEELKGKINVNGILKVRQMGHLKKSRSLGSGFLCHEGRVLCDNDTEEETNRGFSSDSPGQSGLVEPKGSNSPCLSPSSEHHEPPQSESVQVGSDFFNDYSNFSMRDPQLSEKDRLENYDSPISVEVINESGNHVSSIPRMIVKSRSLPSMRHSTPTSGVCFYKYPAPPSRSSEDLRVLEMKSKEVSFHEAERWVMQERERDDVLCETEKCNFENFVDDGYDTYDYSTLAKDWIMPFTDDESMAKNIRGRYSYQQSDESPGKDFKIKRIQEWVNDLSHCSPLEENDVLSESDDMKHDFSYSKSPATSKMDDKITSPGMEAAKRYISSLNTSAAAAQLSNHEFVTIPYLSAFASMRVLNLSGNSIVRITAGVLPRGLHVLNLSKNSISTIEGLRDLTRLRVLDLSYNRILRIGHGLASCSSLKELYLASSLKELYLAGNKISEVEGLHRLIKLAVLDLRFNKISTAKCLGQLAANYNSLSQSLEGNPAQKNVGDEQLKKYLQGLLPHLVYFNRQPIKASPLKDAADRSVRLGISGHQLDRGLRSDKGGRKASHGVSSRPSSSATHGRKNQAADSPKRSRGRHVRLPPPSGTRAVASRHHNFDIANKIFQLKYEMSMRRSRSEGTLGAL